MRKAVLAVILAVVLFTAAGDGQYARQFSLYETFLKEPHIESGILVYITGDVYIFTDYESRSVRFPIEVLAERGLTVPMIVLAVHNHPNGTGPSVGDYVLYRQLLSSGFRGRFLVYSWGGRVHELRLKE